jgi:hypothetical protein
MAPSTATALVKKPRDPPDRVERSSCFWRSQFSAGYATASTPLLSVEASDLETMARNAGARKIALLGGYNE